MKDTEFESIKEVHVDLARENTSRTGKPSTWGFTYKDAEYLVTARIEGGKVRISTKKL